MAECASNKAHVPRQEACQQPSFTTSPPQGGKIQCIEHFTKKWRE